MFIGVDTSCCRPSCVPGRQWWALGLFRALNPFLLPNTLALALGGVQGKIEGPRVTPPGNHPGISRGVRASTFTGCRSAGHSRHHVAAPTTFSDGELKSGHTLQSDRGADWMLTGVFIAVNAVVSFFAPASLLVPEIWLLLLM